MTHRVKPSIEPLSKRAGSNTSRRGGMSIAMLLIWLLTACGSPPTAATSETATQPAATVPGAQTAKLRLATTTSTADSGLLDAILPDFKRRHGAEVEVIAVGTGQALKLGENGDADVVLVHARKREDEFMQQGFGSQRRDVMYNDFVIVGPPDDPTEIKQVKDAATAFSNIAAAGVAFASRGDDSGTFTKEQTIWSSAGITPTTTLAWYKSLGQGMGETLIAADEMGAYTLADRGTYLAMRDKLPRLTLLFGGATIAENPDPALRNPYGVIQVNPDKHTGINGPLAAAFVEWITSADVQQQIGTFGVDRFGQPLFYPQVGRS